MSLLQKEDVELVNATEREFMTALEKPSELLYFKEFIRSRGEDIKYRGPQSFLHRNDATRMSYWVRNSKTVPNKRTTLGLPQRTRFFECEEPGCGKCRCVDAETVEVFSNAAWSKDLLKEMRKVTMSYRPSFSNVLDAYISRLSGIHVTVEDFHDCKSRCVPDIPDDVTQEPLWQYFFAAGFLQALQRQWKDIGDDVLLKEFETNMNDVPGPRFTCNMVSDTTCEDPCDWRTAFETNHDLSQCENMSYETLLGHDAHRGQTHVDDSVLHWPYLLDFMSYVKRDVVVPTPEQRCQCSVNHCSRALPKEQPNGWTFTAYHKDTLHEQHVPITFPGLCKYHDNFLRRAKRNCGLQNMSCLQELQPGESTFRTAAAVPVETLIVTFKPMQNIHNRNSTQQIIYTRKEGEVLWSKVCTDSNDGFPDQLALCRDSAVPVRTAQNRTQFRRSILKRIRDAFKPQ